MPRFRNTDNGRVLEVAESEAFIYEKASNFDRLKEPAAPSPAKGEPKKAAPPAKKKA